MTKEHQYKARITSSALCVDFEIRGTIYPLGPGAPIEGGGVRFYETNIDTIRQFRDQLSAVIDHWDHREMKKAEKSKVLAALRQVQQFEVKA